MDLGPYYVQQQLSSLFLRSFYSEEKARRKGEETTVPTADPIPKPLNFANHPTACPLSLPSGTALIIPLGDRPLAATHRRNLSRSPLW
jgi:hypothetical protein